MPMELDQRSNLFEILNGTMKSSIYICFEFPEYLATMFYYDRMKEA